MQSRFNKLTKGQKLLLTVSLSFASFFVGAEIGGIGGGVFGITAMLLSLLYLQLGNKK